MRKPIIAGNWKMFKTIPEAVELVNELKRNLYNIDNVDMLVCPVFTALSTVADMLNGSNISIGAQDVYWGKQGAYTGEVSADMLKDVGCKYVIVGHSERRSLFGETNESVNTKVKAVIERGLTPIMCVGEKLEERESNKTFDVIKEHIGKGLKEVTAEQVSGMIIAYEPVWAIGTGKTATPAQAQEAHKYIRKLIAELYDEDTASQVRIQYGGSVKPDNAAELIKQPDIDGALVGGASLNADSFTEIVVNTAGTMV